MACSSSNVVALALKKSVLVIGILVGFLFFLPIGSDAAEPNWRAEWERTVEAAKREGQVNVYLYGSTAPLDTGVFQKAYPEISVVGVGGRGDLGVRILAERRAGKFLADVSVHGVNPNYSLLYQAKLLEPIKPVLMLPEVVDQSKWWRGRHHYIDEERQYIFASIGTPTTGGVTYNKNLVIPEQFKSYWDFVAPGLKGKIVVRDPRVPGPGAGATMPFLYHHPDLGPKFLSRLFGDMEVTLSRDERQGTDWLAVGRFPLCFFCSVTQAINQGLPIGQFGPMKEGGGLSAWGGTLALLKNAPHPKAAAVFINWFLSREGQLNLIRAIAARGESYQDSLREDIPKDFLPADSRREKGVQYFDLFQPRVRDMTPIHKLVTDILRRAGK
jgi:iron(III) transport system substrate-binding protein